MESVFFWSEEHAAEYRKAHPQPAGVYLRFDQAAWVERIAQSALFALGPDGKPRR
jgi:hypothetical protein